MTRPETFIKQTFIYAVLVLNCFSGIFRLWNDFFSCSISVSHLFPSCCVANLEKQQCNASWLIGWKKGKKLLKESPIAKMWCEQFLTSSCLVNVCISVRVFSTLLLKCASNSCVHTDGALANPDTYNIIQHFLSIGSFHF